MSSDDTTTCGGEKPSVIQQRVFILIRQMTEMLKIRIQIKVKKRIQAGVEKKDSFTFS